MEDAKQQKQFRRETVFILLFAREFDKDKKGNRGDALTFFNSFAAGEQEAIDEYNKAVDAARAEAEKLAVKLSAQEGIDSEEIDKAALIAKAVENVEEADTLFSGNILTSKYVKKTFFGVCEKIDEIDAEISDNAKNWKLNRLSPATISVLRLAVFEMLYDDLSARIAINEALRLTDLFGETETKKFINGILNSIARQHALIGDAQ